MGDGSLGAAGLGFRPWPSSGRAPGGGSSGGRSYTALGLEVQALADGQERGVLAHSPAQADQEGLGQGGHIHVAAQVHPGQRRELGGVLDSLGEPPGAARVGRLLLSRSWEGGSAQRPGSSGRSGSSLSCGAQVQHRAPGALATQEACYVLHIPCGQRDP